MELMAFRKCLISISGFRPIMIQSTNLKDIKIVNFHIFEIKNWGYSGLWSLIIVKDHC